MATCPASQKECKDSVNGILCKKHSSLRHVLGFVGCPWKDGKGKEREPGDGSFERLVNKIKGGKRCLV